MIVEPGPAGVLPLAEHPRCPSEMRDGPGAQGFKIIPLPMWRVSRSHPSQARRRMRQRPETLGAPLATRGTDDHSAVDAGRPRSTGRAGGMPGEMCECGLLGCRSTMH